MSASNFTHIQVDRIKVETDKAFLVVVGGEEIWLPKSQIADAEDYSEGDCDIELSISNWIAAEKGFD